MGDDPKDKVGQGLSRFSKYTRKQRKVVARVTDIIAGEDISATGKSAYKYGFRIYQLEGISVEERHRALDALWRGRREDIPEDVRFWKVIPMKVIGVSERWFARRTQREHALAALSKRVDQKTHTIVRVVRENSSRASARLEYDMEFG